MQLAEKRVRITLSPLARGWLAERGYDPSFGARPLARLIQTEIKDVLADEILFGRLQQGGAVSIERPGEACAAAEERLETENLCFLVTQLAPARSFSNETEETVA